MPTRSGQIGRLWPDDKIKSKHATPASLTPRVNIQFLSHSRFDHRPACDVTDAIGCLLSDCTKHDTTILSTHVAISKPIIKRVIVGTF